MQDALGLNHVNTIYYLSKSQPGCASVSASWPVPATLSLRTEMTFPIHGHIGVNCQYLKTVGIPKRFLILISYRFIPIYHGYQTK